MVKIDKQQLGDDHPALIIAEVAQAHDGSLGIAHSFIDAAAHVGADAIKFQTHFAKEESSLEEPFRVNFSYEDKTRFDYWRRLEFTPEQWQGLAEHAREKGLIFLSTPFSIKAVEVLEKIGMPAWKVGSGEISNTPLLARMCKTKKPILLSTGMSEFSEIEEIVRFIKNLGAPLILFQCTTKYPTPLAEVGLNVIDDYRKKFDVLVGLSDHSGTLFPAQVAIARGVNIVELHVTFDRKMFGPDSIASIDFAQLETLVQYRDAVHEMLSNPVDKAVMAKTLFETKKHFSQSVVLLAPVKKGEMLTPEVLGIKKPGTGIPASHLEQCYGKHVARDLDAPAILQWQDLVEQKT